MSDSGNRPTGQSSSSQRPRNSPREDETIQNGSTGLKFGVVLSVLFVIGAVIATWYFLREDPKRGTWGDMFGATNALFSGLAFVGVVAEIVLQRQELRLQRLELRETRTELKGQRAALEAQDKSLRKQTFESTFFQLLGFHNEIINGIDLSETYGQATTTTKGRDCFEQFYVSLRQAYVSDSEPAAAYLIFFRQHQADVGHYFRHLYHIIKYVDQSGVEDPKRYTSLVRAQLSSFELLLLFYNCLSPLGSEDFQPLIEKYTLLKNLPFEHLIDQQHKKLYNRDAWVTPNDRAAPVA